MYNVVHALRFCQYNAAVSSWFSSGVGDERGNAMQKCNGGTKPLSRTHTAGQKRYSKL